ncbi:MAG: Hpt domain-containing protein [Gammaproteobacteria bacterium]|nr:Hpt domain-containing protein [Gammaproteobacteria bacterium]
MPFPTNSNIDIEDPFAKRLLSKYLERRLEDLQILREALATQDFETIELAGHNMFGSGAAYGLPPISSIGNKLEQAAMAREAERIRPLIDELENFVSSVTVI